MPSIHIDNAASRALSKLGHKVADKVVAEVKEEVADVRHGLNEVRDGFETARGKFIGYAGVLGFRYSVDEYQFQVSPGLARGTRIDAQGVADLKARGFKSIVNLTRENFDDEAAAKKLGMNFKRISILDNDAPTEKQMVDFLKFVTAKENQPTYIHCQAGKGRTGVATAVYRMAVQGWSPERALAEAKKFGMHYPAQEEFVLSFGKKLAAGTLPGWTRAAA